VVGFGVYRDVVVLRFAKLTAKDSWSELMTLKGFHKL